jgi:hypothetical protein
MVGPYVWRRLPSRAGAKLNFQTFNSADFVGVTRVMPQLQHVVAINALSSGL